MKIAFLMDPLASIDPTWETTSHLMYECNQRGHSVSPGGIPRINQFLGTKLEEQVIDFVEGRVRGAGAGIPNG